MQLPLSIPVSPSRRLIALLVLAHGAALVTLWPLVLPGVVKFALAIAVLGSVCIFFWRTLHARIVSLRLDVRGRLDVHAKVGAGETAIILPQTTVLPGLIVLLLGVGGRKEWLVLPTDATGAPTHRQLRLWLRWRA